METRECWRKHTIGAPKIEVYYFFQFYWITFLMPKLMNRNQQTRRHIKPRPSGQQRPYIPSSTSTHFWLFVGDSPALQFVSASASVFTYLRYLSTKNFDVSFVAHHLYGTNYTKFRSTHSLSTGINNILLIERHFFVEVTLRTQPTSTLLNT